MQDDSSTAPVEAQHLPSSDISSFRATLRASRQIIVVAGAGLSAASGIPTFRDPSGLWRKHDEMSLATPSAFAAHPARVWQFYHARREAALAAQPNPGHYALAMLTVPQHLAALAPDAESFALITQNVDGLSARAANKVYMEAGVNNVYPSYEMHGRVLDTLCTACGRCEPNDRSPITPALGKWLDEHGLDELDEDMPVSELPHCECGGLLRPGVVFFEEIPHDMDILDALVDDADLCIVVGTSSTVQPAASYAYEVAERGGKVAVFNLAHSEGDEYADYLFLGPCAETLPKVLFGQGE